MNRQHIYQEVSVNTTSPAARHIPRHVDHGPGSAAAQEGCQCDQCKS